VTRNTYLLILASGAGAVSLGLFNVVFNLYVLAGGRSQSELGIVLAVTTLGAAAGVLPGGIASDAWGRRPVFVVSGVVAGIATIGECSVTGQAPLLLFGIMSGAAGAAVSVAVLPALVESAPGRAATALAGAGAAGLVGISGGSLFGGWLPGQASVLPVLRTLHIASAVETYRVTLYVGLGIALVAVLPALLWYRDHSRPIGFAGALASLGVGFRRKRVASLEAEGTGQRAFRGGPYLLANVFLGTGAGWAIPYLNLFLTGTRGFSVAQYGTLAATGSLILAVATVATPYVSRRIGMPAAVGISQLVSLAALTTLALARRKDVGAVAYCMRQALMDMTAPAAQGWVTERLDEGHRGVYSSLVLIAFQVPWAITSALGGWLQARTGFGPLFVLTALFYVPAALVFWFAYGKKRADGTQSSDP
jgi:MFS family permease